MPIRVHCPQGCLIRMPANRAGKVVRCPQCKSTIRIAPISATEQKSGKPIPLTAVLVKAFHENENERPIPDENPLESTAHANLNTESQSPAINIQTISIDAAILPANEIVADEDESSIIAINEAMEALEERRQPQPTDCLAPRLSIPDQLTPMGIQKSVAERKSKLEQVVAEFVPVTEVKRLTRPVAPKKIVARRVKPPMVPDSFQIVDRQSSESQSLAQLSWSERIRQANSDRITLTRFFGLVLLLVGMLQLAPAIVCWYQWYHGIDASPLPRWVYWQLFISGLHLIYVIFLWQIPDWSSLKAVSIAMLVVAFLFGVLSTSLLLGGGQGSASAMLGLSFTLVRRGAIWCVAMLCLSTLLAYWGGREAANWQRSEQLLFEIVSGTKYSQPVKFQ